MQVNLNVCNFSSQAATSNNETLIEQNNLHDLLYHDLFDNVKPCQTYEIDEQIFDRDCRSSYVYFHLNISYLLDSISKKQKSPKLFFWIKVDLS